MAMVISGKKSGMITRMQQIIIQQNIEAMFYEKLKAEDLWIEVITEYPNQPIEELVTILTKGLMASGVGKLISILDKMGEREGMEGYGAICEVAFRGAILRLLKEAKGVK